MPIPDDVDLTGWWEMPDPCFIWTSAQIFRRTDSEHPQDYWVVHSDGACLASSSRSTTARLDVSTGLLQISPAARMRLQGPWRYLSVPGRGVALVTSESMKHAARSGWFRDGRWIEPGAAFDGFLKTGPTYTALVCKEAGEDAALREWVLPHGGRVVPGRLLDRG